MNMINWSSCYPTQITIYLYNTRPTLHVFIYINDIKIFTFSCSCHKLNKTISPISTYI